MGFSYCQNINGHGLIIAEFYGIAGVGKEPNRIYAGSQDNDLYMYNNGTWTHHTLATHVGSPVADSVNPDTLYFPRFGGGSTDVHRSIDAGVKDTTIFTPVSTESYKFNIPIVINPQNHRSVYIGCHYLYIFTGLSGSHYQINDNPSGCPNCSGPISAFCIAPTDTSTIYVAFEGPFDLGQPDKLISVCP